MESDPDDLDNIFDSNVNEAEADNAENEQNNNETSEGVRIAPPKRVVKNPRLKFNPERLCGERGIPVLIDHFKDVKFKGNGHEKEDLDKLLSKLEHWTHRLFPSMKFDECLAHIEKLGKKRPVQTCLRKIRLDMPILSSDFVKEDDDVQRNDVSEPEEIDAFDRLIGESQNAPSFSTSANEITPDVSLSPPVSSKISGHVLGSSFGSSLSDEQKERMERNRMLAAERRKARLAALEQPMDSNLESSKPVSSQDVINAENSFNTLFDSVNSTSKSVETSNHDFDMIVIQDNKISADETSLESSNKNSENLGLDDLVDLVDEDECTPLDKNLGSNMQNNCHKLTDLIHKNQENGKLSPINSNSANSVEDVKHSAVESSLELSNMNSENLGLDDLVDLVNEDEAPLTDKQSQHFKFVSCHSDKTDDSVDVIDSNNFSNLKEKNEASLSDSFNDEITLCSKTSRTTVKESMEMESLLNTVDENLRDSQQNTIADCLVKDSFTHKDEGNSLLNCEESTSMDYEDESVVNV